MHRLEVHQILIEQGLRPVVLDQSSTFRSKVIRRRIPLTQSCQFPGLRPPAETHDPTLQSLKPARVPRCLSANTNLPSRKRPVKLLRIPGVAQTALTILARLLVDKGDLLKPQMKITSYNHHARVFPPELFFVLQQPVYSGGRSRRCHVISYRQLTLDF